MFQFRQDVYADVRIEDRFSTSVAYMNGMLKEIKERKEKRAFIRVFDGKMWYFASTTDVSDVQNKLDGLYAQAKGNAAAFSPPNRRQNSRVSVGRMRFPPAKRL